MICSAIIFIDPIAFIFLRNKVAAMYIRQTTTRNIDSRESYTTYRLVRSERIEGKVRQITLLNLGRNFSISQADWPVLCQRIDELISRQTTFLAKTTSAVIEKAAQQYAARLVARSPLQAESESTNTNNPLATADFQEVDINSLESLHPRSVGVEHAALHAMSELGFIEKLEEFGLNGKQRAFIIGNIIGRMANPRSENSTHRWLQASSALGELLDIDFQNMPPMRLYRASDMLMRHKEAIEQYLFQRASEILGFGETVTLYDLTNTYFEGEAESNPKAKRGHSKEKRSDCPLVTLGLVVDGSGFVRRSQTFEGNVSEGKTLEKMLTELKAKKGALIVMDCGIATDKNIEWLKENKYRYLVVDKQTRAFNEQVSAVSITNSSGDLIRIQREITEDGSEVLLHCHSPGREKKEAAMVELFCTRFETGLKEIAENLQKLRGEKRFQKIAERIGRLKEKSHGVSRHYKIEIVSDEKKEKVTGITWEKNPVEGTKATQPGVYCLRSNEMTWSDEKLWRTYIMLTDLESVFRSLKSELGLRPVFHSKEIRVDGHLFITVLAYHFVQFLRTKLKAKGINDSWASLRTTLNDQRRTTVSFKQRNGRTLNVRKSSVPEPELKAIYDALELNPLPGGTKKMLV